MNNECKIHEDGTHVETKDAVSFSPLLSRPHAVGALCGWFSQNSKPERFAAGGQKTTAAPTR